jgi:hypothetical protein
MFNESQLNDTVKKLNHIVGNKDSESIWWTVSLSVDYEDEIVMVWFDPRDPYTGIILEKERKMVAPLIGDYMIYGDGFNDINPIIDKALKSLYKVLNNKLKDLKSKKEIKSDDIIVVNGKRYKLVEED